MKINKYILFLLGGLLLFSCEEYLDKNPESNLSAEKVYSDYELFKGTVDRLTGLLHNYAYAQFDYGGEIGTYSDECMQGKQGDKVLTNVNTGNWQDCGAPGFSWNMGVGIGDGSGNNEFHYRKWTREIPGEASAGIRGANLCIENIDLLEKFPEESVHTPTELKNQLLGQAYLFRAWFYFELIRLYGGMPNMQYAFDTNEDFDVVRPEYWESSQWAVEDAEKAVDLLPERWTLPSDMGRVTKTTAKAVKSMILLYQVSPNMQIPRDQSLSYSGVAPYAGDSLLNVALNASVDALNSALSASTRYRLYDWDEYTDNFYVNSQTQTDKLFSDEAIFQPPFSDRLMMQSWGSGMGDKQTGTGMYMPWWDGTYDWARWAVPTHNAVDFFETEDGYEVGDWHLGQGDAVNNSAVWSKDKPYDNRDPRLKMFIQTHGDKIYLSDEVTAKYSSRGLGVRLDVREGKGHNAADAGKPCNHTGFYIGGKYRWPYNNAVDQDFYTGANMQIFPFIRVAQLYLDMAELGNELGGPNHNIAGAPAGASTPLECINTIRARAQMPPVHEDIYATSKETFRDYIRMERARELFFEQHRWQDLRRWRIAHEVLPKGIYVASISGNDIDNVTYSKKLNPDFVRVFENKHYWYPFMNDDMYLFQNFEQNPGW